MRDRLPQLGKPLGLLLLLLEVQLAVRQKPVVAQVKQPIAIEESQNICPANLPQAIESITNRTEFRYARWGILIQTQSSQTILYSHDRDRYFIPASNIKLITTAAALHRLGADFRIRTSVYGIPLSPPPPPPQSTYRQNNKIIASSRERRSQFERLSIERLSTTAKTSRHYSHPTT